MHNNNERFTITELEGGVTLLFCGLFTVDIIIYNLCYSIYKICYEIEGDDCSFNCIMNSPRYLNLKSV